MPAILCVAASCKEIVRDGTTTCPKHTKTVMVNRNEDRKFTGRANSKIYDSKRWRNISIKKRTVTPFCEECEKNGIITIANVVDHVVEIKDNPKLAYTWSNLRSLCHGHHNTKTGDERRKRKNKI
jgi:5-methylcytosine-specific restriction protein A